jgi:hypothetical protein
LVDVAPLVPEILRILPTARPGEATLVGA